MSETLKPKIGEEFKPAPQLKTLYYIYLMLDILFGVLTWYIPVLLVIPRVSDNAPFIVTLVSIPLLGIRDRTKKGSMVQTSGDRAIQQDNEYRHNPGPHLTDAPHCSTQNSNRGLFGTTNES